MSQERSNLVAPTQKREEPYLFGCHPAEDAMKGENVNKSDKSSDGSIPSPQTGKIRSGIGVLVGAVGFIAASITLWTWLEKPDHEKPFISTRLDDIVINSDFKDNIAIGNRVTVFGKIERTDPLAILANEIEFNGDGEISGPEIMLVSPHIIGGVVRANGGDAQNASGAGQTGSEGLPGGRVYLATSKISELTIEATGGRGGDGTNGAEGANGQPGRCDGFGKWRAAHGGAAGQDGGNGGNGGDGGGIYLVGFQPPSANLKIQGGSGGNPGEGGPGGRGGRGCTGLGGSQQTRPNGPTGARGSPGASGRSSDPRRFPVSHEEMRKRVQDVLKQGPDAIDVELVRATIFLEPGE